MRQLDIINIRTMRAYEVYFTYTQTTYNGVKTEEQGYQLINAPDSLEKGETLEKYINTYRLKGFAGHRIDNIKIYKKKVADSISVNYKADPLEIDLYRNTDVFLNDLEGKCIMYDTMTEWGMPDDNIYEIEIEDVFLEIIKEQGYEMVTHDNTYNWCSAYTDDLDFQVFTKGGADYLYDSDAIILIRQHVGLDIRGGYKLVGAFKNDALGSCESVIYEIIYKSNIQLWATNEETGKEYDFDSFQGGDLQEELERSDMTLVSYNEDTEECKARCNDTGLIFDVRWY